MPFLSQQYQVDEEQALYSFIIFLLETKGITGELVLINDDKQYQLLNKHVLDLLAVAPQVEKLALLISDVIDMISLDEHLIFSKELRKSIEEISQHNSMHQLITILKKINSIL